TRSILLTLFLLPMILMRSQLILISKKLNEKNTAKIKEANLKIYPWTVNDEKDIQKMKELKVDGIITNFPERI
uniref:glycerophosphodiester phosphodiesterase n=1 Tax=Myroides injenensis TaxID=1183151 RepID=UPI000289789C